MAKRRFVKFQAVKAAVPFETIAKMVTEAVRLSKLGLPEHEITTQVYELINKGRVGKKKKFDPPEMAHNYTAGSPKQKHSSALDEARRRWGVRGHVDDDWGTCFVGEMIKGEFKVYGEGSSFSDAFKDAEKKGK